MCSTGGDHSIRVAVTVGRDASTRVPACGCMSISTDSLTHEQRPPRFPLPHGSVHTGMRPRKKEGQGRWCKSHRQLVQNSRTLPHPTLTAACSGSYAQASWKDSAPGTVGCTHSGHSSTAPGCSTTPLQAARYSCAAPLVRALGAAASGQMVSAGSAREGIKMGPWGVEA